MIGFKAGLGFVLNISGIVWGLLDKFVCSLICEGGCTRIVDNNCTLLLLFTAIIFVVCGYVLIVMDVEDRKKLGKEIRKKL